MKREKIEEQIAATAMDIDLLNRQIAEIDALAQKRDNLRAKLDELVSQLPPAEEPGAPELEPLFVFKGKAKDLLEALASEIQKAE